MNPEDHRRNNESWKVLIIEQDKNSRSKYIETRKVHT